MHETRPRGQRGSSASALGVRPYDEDLDDWLGEISDEDWSEGAAERAERRSATSAYAGLPTSDAPAGPAVERARSPRPDPAETRRQVVERRRLVAGLIALVVVGIALVAAVVLLRGGGDTPATSVTAPSATPTAPSETSPSPTQSTPSESASSPPAGTGTPSESSSSTPDTPSTPDTTPSTTGATGFTLPEGTKLKRGEEADAAVVSQLQQALTSAGYDPGPVDGTYGEKTVAAVTAFQQDNGLTADGVVGPDTASALNSALSSG